MKQSNDFKTDDSRHFDDTVLSLYNDYRYSENLPVTRKSAIATVTLCKWINTITGFKSVLDFVQDDITPNQKKAAAQFLQQSATMKALHVGEKKWTDPVAWRE
ncbi:unnamed protein product [Bemisia tabaci]|uniref:Uncharacterized protein n=1 Tax=Bemisia tabaci TaxID=7038 RepID=A0A9P0A3K7_BEMTA|nr:unnamed protein product [Bemisia tabaci]